MELTCLSKGGGFYYPPCHILNVYGFKVLLDCPLDLSALAVFSPIPINTNAILEEDSDNDDRGEKKGKTEKPLNVNSLIYSVPYYKMVASLHLADVISVDVVLISSPMGMLGLPFLTRVMDFSAKIYVTEAAARLGQLMMEELITMHMEQRQFYGSEVSDCPQWMKQEELEVLPSSLRRIILGENESQFGGWLPLYSADELKDCMQKIQSLKYAEEACYNGALTLKPLSSGLEIGSCNWTITSPKGNIACLSSSILESSHAANFDYKGLRGYDSILYSDFSHAVVEADSSSFSSDDVRDSSAISGDLIANLLLNHEENIEEMEKMSFITCAALDSVKLGGSVLIPIGRFGIMQQLLENIATSLESSKLKVPIYFISSVAEELLAFSNIIPEWLCKERQEKLFSGEPLFAHVELIAGKKLHLFTDIYSQKLLNIWEEPCIVFCSRWSLRLGPVVHFLRRWSGDPRSLLVMESVVDADLAFLPFKPMAMKILQCSFLSGLRLQKVQPLLRFLKPKIVLVPENLARHPVFSTTNSTEFIHYSENRTIIIPNLGHNSSELTISTDLACHLDWMELKNESITISKLTGELVLENNKHLLINGNEQQLETGKRGHCSFLWGSINLQNLLEKLQKMGINASLEQSMLDTDSDHRTIKILKPSNALIEIKGTRTVISAADEKLSSSIFEAICNSLNGFLEILEWLRTQHWWDFSEMDFSMLLIAYGKQGEFSKTERVLSYMTKKGGFTNRVIMQIDVTRTVKRIRVLGG